MPVPGCGNILSFVQCTPPAKPCHGLCCKAVLQGCAARLCCKAVLQGCAARLCCKAVLQGCADATCRCGRCNPGQAPGHFAADACSYCPPARLPQLSSLVSEPLPCAPGGEAKLLPLNFTEHLHTKVSELVEGTFLGDIGQVGGGSGQV